MHDIEETYLYALLERNKLQQECLKKKQSYKETVTFTNEGVMTRIVVGGEELGLIILFIIRPNEDFFKEYCDGINGLVINYEKCTIEPDL